jgi:hypothetical protein
VNHRLVKLAFLLQMSASLIFGQANGKLQIHFMDVGQGDGALLISSSLSALPGPGHSLKSMPTRGAPPSPFPRADLRGEDRWSGGKLI